MPYKQRPGESQHQARERVARAKGFDTYSQYRRASAQDRQRATRRLIAESGESSSYRRGARGADVTIRNRARARSVTAAGEMTTTRDRRRLRAIVADAQARGLSVTARVVVQVDAFDRRYRDPRRRKGRDTGVRTIKRLDVSSLDTSSAAAFADDLSDAIADAIDEMYAGAGSSGGWSVETMTVTVA